jgi:hypothetical protein
VIRHEVALDLLQAAALGLRYPAPEVGHAASVRTPNRKNAPTPPIALSSVRKETVTTKLAAQLAMDATLIAAPRILSG